MLDSVFLIALGCVAAVLGLVFYVMTDPTRWATREDWVLERRPYYQRIKNRWPSYYRRSNQFNRVLLRIVGVACLMVGSTVVVANSWVLLAHM